MAYKLIDIVQSRGHRMVIPLMGFPGVQLNGSTLKQNTFNWGTQFSTVFALERRFRPDAVFFFMDLIRNTVLDVFMTWMTSLFSLFVILILITSLFLWEERKTRWIKPLWLSFFTAVLVVFAVQFFVGRTRPFGNVLTMPLVSFVLYSFPSIHTAAAFSALPVLDLEFSKLKWFWLGFAFLIALSRIYIGLHYFSDIAAGAFLGYLIGRFYVLREKGKK